MAQARRRRPRLERIAQPEIHPGEEAFLVEGGPLPAGPPGTLLMIVGGGFGSDPRAVEARLGGEPLHLYPPPLFDAEHLLASVPDVAPGDAELTVAVAGAAAGSLAFTVEPQAEPPDRLAQRFVTLGEALFVLGAAESDAARYGDSMPPELKRRFHAELARERVLFADLRSALAALTPEQAREVDRLVDSSRMVPTLEETLRYLRQGGETQAGVAMEINKKISAGWLDIVEGIGEIADSGLIKGLSKIVRGWFLANYEIELQRKQAHDHEEQERERAPKEEETRKRFESKLDGLEAKGDREEQKLDVQELKLDFVKTLVDRLEGKGDRELQLIDRLEGKADRQDGKLDRQEGKLDKIEAKLDHVEGKVDLAEIKADRAENKLDRLEPKLDKLEPKIDKLEPKLDKLEPKLDKLEPKLDLLEPKLDKVEPKLDSVQAQVERGKEFWQLDGSSWRVTGATRVGVRLEGGGSEDAFSVESIQLAATGAGVVALVVDDLRTDLSGAALATPANVLLALATAPVGASRSVLVELDPPYTGPVEFTGERPHGAVLCTLVEGAGATQTSPRPCP